MKLAGFVSTSLMLYLKRPRLKIYRSDAVVRIFAQLAVLADFNATLQGSQGEVTYQKDCGSPRRWNDASSVARR